MKFETVHTCIRVADLEASVKFYTEALGYVETRRMDKPEDQFTLVFLSDGTSQHQLELTYNYDHGPYDIGNGFSHVAMVTDDLEAAHGRHRSLGYQVTEMYSVRGGKPNIYFITDPDGYDVEIIQR